MKGGQKAAALEIDMLRAKIIDETGKVGDMVPLGGKGYSQFSGSSPGRRHNISVTLKDMTNIFAMPGEVISFNSYLDPSKWVIALVILRGKIEPGYGGGTCQTSTTFFRAVLNSGLEVLRRKAHSMYVSYYWLDGEHNGLDATVYLGRGGVDFKFKNNYEDPVLFQAYEEGDNAFVTIFGIPDGREVIMDGPFYHGDDIPEEYQDIVSPLRWNQVAWVQRVIWPDGRMERHPWLSTYDRSPKPR